MAIPNIMTDAGLDGYARVQVPKTINGKDFIDYIEVTRPFENADGTPGTTNATFRKTFTYGGVTGEFVTNISGWVKQ